MAATGAADRQEPGGVIGEVQAVSDRTPFQRALGAAAAGEHLGAAIYDDVLGLELRPSRVIPLLDAWVDRFAGAVRRGDHAAAARWMRVMSDRQWSGDLQKPADDALDRATTRELVETLVVDLTNNPGSPSGGALIGAWGRRLVGYFAEWIVVDDPPVSRKHLVDHLAAVGRADVDALLPYLDHPRWFVVRNFATAVGRSSDPVAVDSLIRCLQHSDDRVRVEALRGVAAIRRDGAVTAIVEALRDESERVRQAAISLLRAVTGDDVVSIIAEVIDDKGVDASDARRLVGVIAERPSEVSRPVLEAMASRRAAFGIHKAARDAARIELASRYT